MTKNAIFALLGAIGAMFLWTPRACAQSYSGTSLTITGTGSAPGTATIDVLTSGTATFNDLTVTGLTDLHGNSLYFGTVVNSGTLTEQGLSISYNDGTDGINSAFTLLATRPSLVWNWQRLTASGSAASVMQIDASNRLILTGTDETTPPQLVLDPNGTVSLNGSNLLTQASADLRYVQQGGSGGTVLGNGSATGSYSIATGYSTAAFGSNSTAMGSNTIAQSYGQTVLGQYNTPLGSSTTWVPTDELFTIGNGTAANACSNAFVVKKNGDTIVNGKLTISGSASIDQNGAAQFSSINCLSSYGGRGTFYTLSNYFQGGFSIGDSSYNPTVQFIKQIGNSYDLWVNGQDFRFMLGDLSSKIEAMRITKSGSVGIGTANPQSALDVVGDVRSSGMFIEKSVAFTPTAVGWYRIMSASHWASSGGSIKIMGAYDNTVTDIELQFNVAGYEQGGSIQQTRYSNYNGGAIDQARISSQNNMIYLDVHVKTANTPAPIAVYGYGPNLSGLVANSSVGAVPGPSGVSVLTLGHGFRSTAGANLAETSGNVGIGTVNPQAKLDVSGSANITGDATINGKLTVNGVISGTNNRMPFQVLTGTASILTQGLADQRYLQQGLGSSHMVLGSGTSTGWCGIALGAGSLASGEISTAIGNATTASGYISTAMGRQTLASDLATAMGDNTQATGYQSTAMGRCTIASGIQSTAMGYSTTASGEKSVAMGLVNTAQGYAATATGGWNLAAGDYSFTLGHGCSAIGKASIAGGSQSYASGENSIAIGEGYATASKANSVAIGYGPWASGTCSFAFGLWSNAQGDYSQSLGNYVISQGYAQTAIGQFNVAQGDSNNWIPTDDLLIVGNGTDNSHRANAFVVKKNGNAMVYGNLTVTGTANQITGNTTVTGTSTLNGDTKINGALVVTGTMVNGTVVATGTSQLVLIPQQGDISMGSFTNGATPQ